ncbi:MAG: Uma2 family endonuclease [Saprospiraceae bacterium]|jgi:Uma2 family endonuclease
MQAEKLSKISIEEYIEIEKTNDTKYEYHDGSIYAMAGGTMNHGFICGNIYSTIKASLRAKNKKCTTMTSELKLRIEVKDSYVYPDAMVVCGDIETSDRKPDTVTNPTVIVEVLSKSTAAYDRGDKFYLYRQIESLQEYVLIEQEKAEIEVYTKKGNLWQITRFTGIDTKLLLSSIDVEIGLSEIYEDVVFAAS